MTVLKTKVLRYTKILVWLTKQFKGTGNVIVILK